MRRGLIASYQKCPHLGCRVPQCTSSQWFECGCHGSQYNRVGEKKGGPPREAWTTSHWSFRQRATSLSTPERSFRACQSVCTTGKKLKDLTAWEQVTTNDRSNNHFNRMGASHRRDGGLHRVPCSTDVSEKNSGLKLSRTQPEAVCRRRSSRRPTS